MPGSESKAVYVFKRDQSESTLLVRPSDEAEMQKYATVYLYDTADPSGDLDKEFLRAALAEMTGRTITRAPAPDPKIQDLRIAAFFEALTDALSEGNFVEKCATPFGFYLEHEVPSYSLVVTRTSTAGTGSFAVLKVPTTNDLNILKMGLSSACYAMATIEPVLQQRASLR
jgi:hypothetical protein